MTTTNGLFLLIVASLIALYVQSYLKTKDEYTIVQTYLDKITIDTLYDKYPVVIYDQLQDPRALLTSLFAYSYQFENMISLPPIKLHKTRSKFTIIYTSNESVTIHIVSPKYKVDGSKPLQSQDKTLQYVTVNLKPHQILIMPMQWHYETTKTIRAIELDDVLSALLKAFNFL